MIIVQSNVSGASVKTRPVFKSVEYQLGWAYDPGRTVALPTHSPGDLIVVFYSNFMGVVTPPAAGGTVPQWNQIQSVESKGYAGYTIATRSDHTTGVWGNDLATWHIMAAVFTGVNPTAPIGGSVLNKTAHTATEFVPDPISLVDSSGASAILYMAHSQGPTALTSLPSASVATPLANWSHWNAPNGSNHVLASYTKVDTTSAPSINLGTYNSTGNITYIGVELLAAG